MKLCRLLIAVAVVGLMASLPGQYALAQRVTSVVFAQATAPTNLDTAGVSLLQVYPAGTEAAFLIYDGLLHFNGSMAFVPELATSWSTAPDGVTWTFHLRSGAVFHDGTPLNAQAVAFVLNRDIDKKTNPSDRALWDPLVKAEAINDTTLRIVTQYPFPALLNLLAHQDSRIISPAAVQKYGDNYKTNPVGSGPYRVDHWDVGTELDLVRNDRYWGARPTFDRVTLRYTPDPATRIAMIESGQAQVIDGILPENISELRSQARVQVIERPSMLERGIAFNMNKPIFQDLRVRHALNYAVDKNAIIKGVFGGHASPVFSPVSPMTPEAGKFVPYTYDKARAQRLLADAGWAMGANNILQKNGRPFHLNFVCPDGWFLDDVKVCEAVQGYLRDIGVDASIEKLEAAVYRTRIIAPPAQKHWDLALYGFNPSNGDSFFHLEGLFLGGYLQNIGSYSDPQTDMYIKTGERTIDRAKHRELSQAAQRQIWQDAPYIWLYAEPIVVAQQRGVPDVTVLPNLFVVLRPWSK